MAVNEFSSIKDRLAAYRITVEPCSIEGKRHLRHHNGVSCGNLDAKQAAAFLARLDRATARLREYIRALPT